MDNEDHILEGHPDNFGPLVLENSIKGPVVVYFLSPNAGPCMRLLPRLVKLSDEYQGLFLLVVINTDEHGVFVKQLGVTSIPTVRIYRNEQVVETIYGAYSENIFRAAIKNHLDGAAANLRQAAAYTYQQGTPNQALTLMERAAAIEPRNWRIHFDQAKVLVREGRYAEAADILDRVPDAARDLEMKLLRNHLDLILSAQQAPTMTALQSRLRENELDHEARFYLAARLTVQDDFGSALQNLCKVLQSASGPMVDRARRGMLAILSALVPEHPLSQHYETKLQDFSGR